ncbi:MAG: outer membrane protein assembly factor BamD [Bacteroidaceae bacterium]|nr:outer membrane protein assembly factor BamD [Bacteroidaceae bacterium]
MKKNNLFLVLLVLLLSSCMEYSRVLKSTDYEYKYEAAKEYFVNQKYSKTAPLLEELITVFKGTDKAEESLYMLAMCYYEQGDYTNSSSYFTTYFTTYPRGKYSEEARFRSALALYNDSPEPALDQSVTYESIQQMQIFIDYYPNSKYRKQADDILLDLQNKLVEKEYEAAKLYYDLGNYMGNNYRSCITTAQNAINEYPYANARREDLSFLILRAKFDMARNSVVAKKEERFRDTLDEYYSFINEYPKTKYADEVQKIFEIAKKKVKD